METDDDKILNLIISRIKKRELENKALLKILEDLYKNNLSDDEIKKIILSYHKSEELNTGENETV